MEETLKAIFSEISIQKSEKNIVFLVQLEHHLIVLKILKIEEIILIN